MGKGNRKECPNCRHKFGAAFAQNPRINTALTVAIRAFKSGAERPASKPFERWVSGCRQALAAARAAGQAAGGVVWWWWWGGGGLPSVSCCTGGSCAKRLLELELELSCPSPSPTRPARPLQGCSNFSPPAPVVTSSMFCSLLSFLQHQQRRPPRRGVHHRARGASGPRQCILRCALPCAGGCCCRGCACHLLPAVVSPLALTLWSVRWSQGRHAGVQAMCLLP